MNVRGHWLQSSGYKFCPFCGIVLSYIRLLVEGGPYKLEQGLEINYTASYEDFVHCDNEECDVGPTIIRDLRDPE